MTSMGQSQAASCAALPAVAPKLLNGGGAGSLAGLRLHTVDLPEGERRSAYLHALDDILRTEFIDPDFRAMLDSFHIGALHVIMLEASARVSERTAARIAIDRHDALGVQLAVAGRARGQAGRRLVVSEPGDVMILDYTQPYRIRDDETRVVVNVTVPRALFPAGSGDLRDLHGTVLRGGAAEPLAAYLRSLPAILPIVPEAAGDGLARVFLDLLGIARGCYGEGAAADVAAGSAHVIARAERLVDSRLGSPDLTPAWLADRLGVSRSELYALFARHDGVSRFVLGRRLAAAHAALEDQADTRRVGQLAFAFGFSSGAHFARTFRQAFGKTATEVRRQAAS